MVIKNKKVNKKPKVLKKKEVASSAIETSQKEVGSAPTEKEHLQALHKELLDLGIHSIGDLEVKISRL